MAKLTILFTILFTLINLPLLANYDDNTLLISKTIKSCVEKENLQVQKLKSILNLKYSESPDKIEVHGVSINSPRNGLVSNFLSLINDYKNNKAYSANEIFHNSDYKKCDTIYCLADEIFGKDLGVYYLYILDEYHMNLSHLSEEEGIAKFTRNELLTILGALQILPKESLKGIKFGRHMKRIKKSKGTTIANATVHLFNLWGEINDREKITTIIHELGHVFSDHIASESADQSVRWAGISNWQWDRESLFDVYSAKKDPTMTNFVSWYAKRNPVEDFAESFTAYILNPEYLRDISEEKYVFMRDNVFGGIEYNSIFCHFSANNNKLNEAIENYNFTSASDIAKTCESSFVKTLVSLDMTEYKRCISRELIGQKDLPITYNPNYLNKVFKDTYAYQSITTEVINLFAERTTSFNNCELSPSLFINNMDESFGQFGYSTEIYDLAPNLCRWTKRLYEHKNLKINESNTKSLVKELLYQRAN